MIKNWVNKTFYGIGRAFGVTSQRSDPPVRGTQNFLESYDASPWVRAVTGRVATSVGETQWKLWRTDTDEEVKDSKHILLRTLKKPNTLLSASSFMRVTQLSLDLTADAFWLIKRNGLGAPTELWPIPAHWVADLPISNRRYFRISWQEWQAQIPESEVVWIHDPSPASPYARGHGIVQALSDEIAADEYASKHVGAMFFNRAMPEVVIMDPGAHDDELEIHERHWLQRLQGLYKAMKPYFVNRELKFWQPNQMNLDNLTLVPLRKFQRDMVLQTFGLPPEQLGINATSNRATAEVANYVYEDRLIRPRRQFLADELTLKLAPLYDERLEVRFVDTVPGDKEYAKSLASAFNVIFTVDELRGLANYAAIGGTEGNMRIVALNQKIVKNLAEAHAQSQQQAAPNEEKPPGAGSPLSSNPSGGE